MPMSQPGPLLAVIAIVALTVMGLSVFVGVTAQMSAGQPAAASSEATPPPGT